jgi:hypothetical protein
MFWTSPNLDKYSYGWFPLEQHYKIEKTFLVWTSGVLFKDVLPYIFFFYMGGAQTIEAPSLLG